MIRHLALVHRPELFSVNDYTAIVDEIGKRCDDIRVFIYPDVESLVPLPELAEHPLMTFCPSVLRHFKAPRGKVFSGQRIRKDEQLRLLAKGGVRVPRWGYSRPGLRLSEHEWGPFVIVKPIRFGHASRGRGIELVSTSGFRHVSPEMMSVQGKAASDTIIQRFIDTGDYSEDYRVVTIFGRPLYAFWRKSLVRLQRPDGNSVVRTTEGVVSNATSGGPREVAYCYDKDVLAFASSCYRAIPQVPFQAIDVRRGMDDGRLYCLEINPGGLTWNFSSQRAQDVPTIDGIRREDQFGAWGIAADALIEKTRLFAG